MLPGRITDRGLSAHMGAKKPGRTPMAAIESKLCATI
jgi:hypothetical protein